MNKVQRTASKVFTPEFMILLQSILQQYVDDDSVSELIKHLDKHANKKKISDCLIALSFYLVSLLSEQEDAFDKSFNHIRKEDADNKTEQYIR